MPPRKIEGTGRESPDLTNIALGPEMSSDTQLTLEESGVSPRRVRVPFGGSEFKMTATAQPDYHLHWFNDRPGRIDRAKKAGYEHILNEKGEPTSMVVDTQPGGGMLAYAMEIPNELWEEDMKANQKKVDEQEAVIRQGMLNKKPGDGRYIPPGAINIRRGS